MIISVNIWKRRLRTSQTNPAPLCNWYESPSRKAADDGCIDRANPSGPLRCPSATSVLVCSVTEESHTSHSATSTEKSSSSVRLSTYAGFVCEVLNRRLQKFTAMVIKVLVN